MAGTSIRFDFDRKVAVVVGGTSGIGRATTVAFGEAGARVVVAGRSEDEGGETVELVRRAGGEATFVRVGVADANVGDLDTEVRTNTRGVLLCLKHEIRHMSERGGGAIVNTSSTSRLRPTAAQALYGLSQAAVTYLTRSAAAGVGKAGIRVDEIAPAQLMSDMVRAYFEGPDAIPLDDVSAGLALDHVGEPEAGAAATLFLCSEAARYITGVTLPVDGGFLLYNAGSA